MALPFQGPLDPNTYASQLSARWASTSAHRGVFARLGPPQKRRTASDLAGTHFTQGRVADPQNQRYQDLLTARTIASRGTLHAYHVNLESNIGQWLKANYDLPFQSHSRVDTMKAAVQAEKTFGEAGAKGGMALAPASEESLLARAMQRYGTALSHFQGEIDRPIAAGVESMAVRMKSGNILKLSSETMEADWGSRPFDVPILQQGTLPGATPVHYQIQPEVQIARTPDESARFFGALKQAGYSVWDPGERQFGYYQGKAVLVDYSAVTARAGAPLKEIAQESLSRANIEGKAIGAAVRSPMEAAEKVVAKETLHELHVNLESGVGGWLKKAMRLPFKAKSRVDPIAAAGGAPPGRWKGPILPLTGLAIGTALTLSAAMGSRSEPETSQPRDSHSGGRGRGETEARRERRRTRTVGRGQPSARTTMTLRDHPWDLAQVDDTFSRHTRTGYAYSPSTD